MLTVRSRAMELASDPSTFQDGAPVEVFSDIGRTKLEADAYLAICANYAVSAMVGSKRLHDSFLEFFPSYISAENRGKPNSGLDAREVAVAFEDCFLDVYSHTYTGFDDILQDTPFGRKTFIASQRYSAKAELHMSGKDMSQDDRQRYRDYAEPVTLFRIGMQTLGDRLLDAVVVINDSGLEVDDRAAYLIASERSVRSMASISMAQAASGHQVLPKVAAGHLDMAPQIGTLRSAPVHKDEHSAAIRPHHGCVAMPDMSGAEGLYEGSAIGKLWHMGAGLMVESNVHALDSDEPRHAIFPQTAEAADPA